MIQNHRAHYKVDCIVADTTQSMKLVLWNNTVDQVQTGKSYLFKHLTVRTFSDLKFVNINESTKITEIADIGI